MLEITMGQQMMAWIGTKVAQSCFLQLLFYYSNVFLDSEAWPFHLVSTISEWVMAASFFCFLLTMWFDFSYLTLTVNCDRTNLNLDTWFRKINAFIYKFHSNHLIIRNLEKITKVVNDFLQETAWLKIWENENQFKNPTKTANLQVFVFLHELNL